MEECMLIPAQETPQEPQPVPAASKPGGSVFWQVALYCFFAEIVLRLATVKPFTWTSFCLTVVFSLVWASVADVFLALLPKRGRIALRVFVIVLAVVYCTQIILRRTFGFYYTMSIIAASIGDVLSGFGGTAKNVVLGSIGVIVPFAIVIALLWRCTPLRDASLRCELLHRGTRTLTCLALAFLLIGAFGKDCRNAYVKGTDSNATVETFGLLHFATRDVFASVRALLGLNGAAESADSDDFATPSIVQTDATAEAATEPDPNDFSQYPLNTLTIDFAARAAAQTDVNLRAIDEYCGAQTPSHQNQYTGLFQGKNLILICGEAFSPYFISETLTPTLYRMLHGGFTFSDYYQPSWGASTSDGEYSSLMGLIPKSGVNSMYASRANALPFTLGNALRNAGYFTWAYHNGSYTYYKRHLTHENLGYNGYTAVGGTVENGVKTGSGLTLDNYVWPNSDLEMMTHTLPDYQAATPFHIYYMSVSGHCEYNFDGNYQARKNESRVADLDCSEAVKAYIACNLDLEDAVTKLETELRAQGVWEDTVIVIAPDHYPYGLDLDWAQNQADYYKELVAFAGHDDLNVEDLFDRYKNALILYNAAMETPVAVDAPVYSIDILPTLLNLFGVPFDSRLLVGRDVLSDAPPLVILRSGNWMTDKGRYYAATNTFVPSPGAVVDEAYVTEMRAAAENKVLYSGKILEKNYYATFDWTQE